MCDLLHGTGIPHKHDMIEVYMIQWKSKSEVIGPITEDRGVSRTVRAHDFPYGDTRPSLAKSERAEKWS